MMEFEHRWKNGNVWCEDTTDDLSGQDWVKEESDVPDICPYQLEQLLEAQNDVQ